MKIVKIAKYSAILVILVFLLSLVLFVILKRINFNANADTSANYVIMPFGGTMAPEWRSIFNQKTIRTGNGGSNTLTGEAWVNNMANWANVTMSNLGWTKIYLSGEKYIDSMVKKSPWFSQASSLAPSIYEVSMDDFVSNVRRTLGPSFANAPQPDIDILRGKLDTISSQIHSSNPNLKFGLTIYEDDLFLDSESDLVSQAIDRNLFSQNFCNQVNIIHLYIHYRANSDRFQEAVNLAKTYFPNAQIIAGSYAYDRIDYINCDMANAGVVDPSKKCTETQEKEYFTNAITSMAALLGQGQISGIEFWPAFFGTEEQIWLDNNGDCENKTRCVSNTKLMRQKAVSVLHQYLPEIPLIGVTKAADTSTFATTRLINYEIKVVNLSDQTVVNAQVSDDLPAGTNYNGSDNGGALGGNNNVSWVVDQIAVGASKLLHLNVGVN